MASKLEAADDEYKHLGTESGEHLQDSAHATDDKFLARKLMEDMPKPCPLALINYLAYAPVQTAWVVVQLRQCLGSWFIFVQ